MESNPQAGKAEGANERKRKRKEIAPFGNHRNYYGYRIGQEFEEDPRLKVLTKEWFDLDIGCNNGLITIAVARRFHCQSILGIDIDPGRIKDADWNLRNIVRKENVSKVSSNTSKIEVLERANGLCDCPSASSNEQTSEMSKNCSACKKRDISSIVSFQQENFFECNKMDSSELGDDGLITLFVKMWKLLHPRTAANYSEIIYFPNYFQEILLDKVGFRKVENLTSSLSSTKTGFNRPILTFQN